MLGRLRRSWVEMTTQDFQQTDMSRVIAILPVAAIEQHGPHLPVEVDTAINRGILARAMELLAANMPVTVLPAMPVGKSNEHISYPGTLTLTAETLIRLWTEIGESVARAGVRKLVLFNSHGGQPQIADIVARDLRVRHDMFVVTASTYGLGKPPGLFPESELKHGIHGGSIETSIMMYLCPDLVRRDELANFRPRSLDMEGEYAPRRGINVSQFKNQAIDMCESYRVRYRKCSAMIREWARWTYEDGERGPRRAWMPFAAGAELQSGVSSGRPVLRAIRRRFASSHEHASGLPQERRAIG